MCDDDRLKTCGKVKYINKDGEYIYAEKMTIERYLKESSYVNRILPYESQVRVPSFFSDQEVGYSVLYGIEKPEHFVFLSEKEFESKYKIYNKQINPLQMDKQSINACAACFAFMTVVAVVLLCVCISLKLGLL